MAQIYHYGKIRYDALQVTILFIWFTILKMMMKSIPIGSLLYLIPFVLGGLIIKFLVSVLISKISWIEIGDKMLNRKILSYVSWSIPISSISNIAPMSYKAVLIGYLIKTKDNKFYKIPHNLVNYNDFIKDLLLKKPDIIQNQQNYDETFKIFTGTEISQQYIKQHGIRNLIIGMSYAILLFTAFWYVWEKFSAP